MQHRDIMIIKKVISELEIGIELVGNNSVTAFINNELLKRVLAVLQALFLDKQYYAVYSIPHKEVLYGYSIKTWFIGNLCSGGY